MVSFSSDRGAVAVETAGVSDGGTDATGACNVYVLPAAPDGAFAMADGRAAHPADHYFGCGLKRRYTPTKSLGRGAAEPRDDVRTRRSLPGQLQSSFWAAAGSVSPSVGHRVRLLSAALRRHHMEGAGRGEPGPPHALTDVGSNL
jgi:hypothetical protein